MRIMHLLRTQALHRLALWEDHDFIQKVNSEWVLLRKPPKVATTEYMGNILPSWYDTLFSVFLCIFIKGKPKIMLPKWGGEISAPRFLNCIEWALGIEIMYLREILWLRYWEASTTGHYLLTVNPWWSKLQESRWLKPIEESKTVLQIDTH